MDFVIDTDIDCLPLPRVDIVQAYDIKYMLFDSNDNISRGIRNSGSHDIDVENFSRNILDHYNDGFILDIGANLGSFSVPLALAYPKLNFLSFEPQRIIYYQLCGNIFLNSIKNVNAYNFGLGDFFYSENSVIPNYALEGVIGAFSIDDEVRKADNYGCPTVGGSQVINVTTLDSLNISNIRLIKMDVEGFELKVIKGALKTLERNNYPCIIFEAWSWGMHHRRIELFRFLESLGYNIVTLESGSDHVAEHRTSKRDKSKDRLGKEEKISSVEDILGFNS